MKYVIITPAKNESKYIQNTIDSVINQTIRPTLWVIVDDGSTDQTKIIAESYSKNYNWIKVIESNKLEERQEGAPIIKAFYIGYELIKDINWDVIVKLDADLGIPNNYFEMVLAEFHKDPKLGMCGGYCIEEKKGRNIRIKHASYHIRGAFKSLNKNCWDDIGGFKPVLGWDGIDEMNALYKGWKTKNIEVGIFHYRPTASYYNQKKLAFKYGYAKYKNGSGFLITLLSAIRRIIDKPYFLYSLYYMVGYIKAYYKKEEKNVSKDLSKFINKFHLKRIIKL